MPTLLRRPPLSVATLKRTNNSVVTPSSTLSTPSASAISTEGSSNDHGTVNQAKSKKARRDRLADAIFSIADNQRSALTAQSQAEAAAHHTVHALAQARYRTEYACRFGVIDRIHFRQFLTEATDAQLEMFLAMDTEEGLFWINQVMKDQVMAENLTLQEDE